MRVSILTLTLLLSFSAVKTAEAAPSLSYRIGRAIMFYRAKLRIKKMNLPAPVARKAEHALETFRKTPLAAIKRNWRTISVRDAQGNPALSIRKGDRASNDRSSRFYALSFEHGETTITYRSLAEGIAMRTTSNESYRPRVIDYRNGTAKRHRMSVDETTVMARTSRMLEQNVRGDALLHQILSVE